MLHVLPAEVTLIVLSRLPIPSLSSLAVLSCQWFHFLATHQSQIFHCSALYHEYIPPGMLFLEDALSMSTGKPWAGSTSWKDFCKSLPCHSSVYISTHCLPPTNGTPAVTRIVKATGHFNFAKAGREKGMLLRARYHPHVPTSTTSRSTKRQGYASRPTFAAASP